MNSIRTFVIVNPVNPVKPTSFLTSLPNWFNRKLLLLTVLYQGGDKRESHSDICNCNGRK